MKTYTKKDIVLTLCHNDRFVRVEDIKNWLIHEKDYNSETMQDMKQTYYLLMKFIELSQSTNNGNVYCEEHKKIEPQDTSILRKDLGFQFKG